MSLKARRGECEQFPVALALLAAGDSNKYKVQGEEEDPSGHQVSTKASREGCHSCCPFSAALDCVPSCLSLCPQLTGLRGCVTLDSLVLGLCICCVFTEEGGGGKPSSFLGSRDWEHRPVGEQVFALPLPP